MYYSIDSLLQYYIKCAEGLHFSAFSFYYEYKYMKNLIKNNIILAKKFNNTMRYIDDLLTLNTCNTQFDAAIQDIYPQELQLKNTSMSSNAMLSQLSTMDSRVTLTQRVQYVDYHPTTLTPPCQSISEL